MAVSDSLGSGERTADRPEVQVTEAVLYDDVEAMLRTMGSSLHGYDLLILPPYQRGGQSLYGPDDVDAVRLARSAGLNAAFLHGAQDREYLHEYSAGWVVEFAIAASAHVTAINLTAMAKYFMARARKAVDEGLHEGPAEQVTLRVKIARFRRDADGAVTLKRLNIEGPASAASAALHTLLSPDLKSKEIAQPVVIENNQAELKAFSQPDIHNPQDSELHWSEAVQHQAFNSELPCFVLELCLPLRVPRGRAGVLNTVWRH
jgi:hypothetical protein